MIPKPNKCIIYVWNNIIFLSILLEVTHHLYMTLLRKRHSRERSFRLSTFSFLWNCSNKVPTSFVPIAVEVHTIQSLHSGPVFIVICKDICQKQKNLQMNQMIKHFNRPSIAPLYVGSGQFAKEKICVDWTAGSLCACMWSTMAVCSPCNKVALYCMGWMGVPVGLTLAN